jgi:hypothetical protein
MDERVVRRYAASVLAGMVSGAVWVGVVSRLAMLVLARTNPETDGIRSDDDFEIGRFTLSGSLNLLVVGVLLGALGGSLYVGLRGLRVGPAWFQLVSITFAPAVVALAVLVHPNGVDFTLLRPLGLAVGLFLVVLWGYTLTVALLAERWLRPGGFAETMPRWLVIAGLPSFGFFPVPIGLLLGRLVLRAAGPALATRLALPARAVLLGVFSVAVVDLASDLRELS